MIHAAGRPPVWWLDGDAYMTKIFPFTRNVGAVQASTSLVSGSDRQIFRNRATGSRDAFDACVVFFRGLVAFLVAMAIFGLYSVSNMSTRPFECNMKANPCRG